MITTRLSTFLIFLIFIVGPQSSKANVEALRLFKVAYTHDQSAANLYQYLLALNRLERTLPDLMKTSSVPPTLMAMEANYTFAEKNTALKDKVLIKMKELIETSKSSVSYGPTSLPAFEVRRMQDHISAHRTYLVETFFKDECQSARKYYVDAENNRTDKTQNTEIQFFDSYARALIAEDGSFVEDAYENNKPTFDATPQDLDFIFPAAFADAQLFPDAINFMVDHSLAFLWYVRAATAGSRHAATQVALRLTCGASTFQDVERGEEMLGELFPPENQLPNFLPTSCEETLGKSWSYRTSMFGIMMGIDLLTRYINPPYRDNLSAPFCYMALVLISEYILKQPHSISVETFESMIACNDYTLPEILAKTHPHLHARDCCLLLNMVNQKLMKYLFPQPLVIKQETTSFSALVILCSNGVLTRQTMSINQDDDDTGRDDKKNQ